MSNDVSEINYRMTSSIASVSAKINQDELKEKKKVLRVALRNQGAIATFKDHEVDRVDIWALSDLLLEPEFEVVTSLCLEDNELEDDDLAKLSEMLKSNTRIVDLDLSDNRFTQVGVHYLVNALKDSDNTLRSLSLEDNTKIEGPGVAYLGQILETCSSLTKLNVSGIPLQSNLDPFIDGIKGSTSLTSLILENTRLDGEIMELFLDQFCSPENKCRVTELNLNYNQCDSFTVYHPVFTHEAFNRLKKLHLSYSSEQEYSGYKKKPVKLIFNYMKNNRSIEELYLKGNNFMNRDCHSLRSLLKLKSKLKILDLSDNNIEMTGATLLINCLTDNNTLHHLILDGNRFLEEKGGHELYLKIDEKLLPNRRVRNERGSCMTGKKSKLDRRMSERVRSDGSMQERRKSRFPSGGNRSSAKSDNDSGSIVKVAVANDSSIQLRPLPMDADGNFILHKGSKPKSSGKYAANLDDDWDSVVRDPSRPKTSGKYAANLEGDWDSVVRDPSKPKTSGKYAANLDGDWDSVVRDPSKPKTSGKYAANLDGDWDSVVRDPSKPKTSGKYAANLDGDWDSVVKDPSKPKTSGKYAANLDGDWDSVVKDPSKPKTSGKYAANLDDDWDSVVRDAPVPQSLGNPKLVNNLGGESESVVHVDDDNSVVYLDEEDGEDFDSVVFEEEEKPKKSVLPHLLRAKDSSRFLVKDDFEDDFSERSSNNTPANWEYREITKSEMSYISHIRLMYSGKKTSEEAPAAIVDLTPSSVAKLEKMLSEFENLLDREENSTSIRVGKKVKRNFAKKFGIIGQLNKQKPGKVFDYTLAKSVIDKTLISRQLVRNITLINQFAKLRRQIGSGVPTKLGGMLPSIFFGEVVSAGNGMISIEQLESFASSLLLIKVVVWSIFKAFTLSDPHVDPEGRKLLAEFGKAMIEKDNKANHVDDYKKKSENYIAEKKSQLGKYIITGAVHELIDLLVLLRPMYAIAEALYVTVASDNPQPSLEHYDSIHRYQDKRARKKLARKYKKVKKVNRAMAQLGKLKNRKATVDKDDQQRIKAKQIKAEQKVNKLLNGVEQMQKKNKVNKRKGSRVSKRSMQKKIEISPEVIKYRKNCPERVLNVLSDISVETESLVTILSVKDFFPTMISFCDYDKTVVHYEKTTQGVLESMQGWVNSLSEEFAADILQHFAPSITNDIKKDVKPKRNFTPKGNNSLSKNNSSSKPAANNELMNVFNRIKKKKKMSVSVDEILKKPLKPEDESFFNPVLNNLFSWKKLTHGGSEKIRDVVAKKLKDHNSRNREDFVKHLRYLCANGCKKTISMQTLETRDMFADGNFFSE